MKNLLNRIAILEEKQFTSELTAQEQKTYHNLIELATKYLTSK